jgi:hypothetical protein
MTSKDIKKHWTRSCDHAGKKQHLKKKKQKKSSNRRRRKNIQRIEKRIDTHQTHQM